MKTTKFMQGFLTGTLVGVGIGLLLTALSDDSREEIMKGAKKLAGVFKDTALETVDELKGSMRKPPTQ